jgi:hypothetical protein
VVSKEEPQLGWCVTQAIRRTQTTHSVYVQEEEEEERQLPCTMHVRDTRWPRCALGPVSDS